MTNRQIHLIDIEKNLLSAKQRNILSLGLNYIPVRPINYDKLLTQLSQDVYEASEKMLRQELQDKPNIKKIFYVKKIKNTTDMNLVINSNNERLRDIYLNKNIRDNFLKKILHKHSQKIDKTNNIIGRNSEQKILNELMDNKDIIIKPSDKNLGIAIMSKTWYNSQLELHIGNKTNFQLINNKETKLLELKMLLSNHCKIHNITGPLLKFIQEHNDNGTPAKFYIIPKIHKTPIQSRPIAADHSSQFCNLSKVLSSIFNNLTINHKSIITGTKQLASILNTTWINENITLVTADIENLYPTMNSYHRAIMVSIIMEELKDGITIDGYKLSSDFIRKSFLLILDNHYVTVENNLYHQKKGVATGTSMAPSYANITLAKLEEKLINSKEYKHNIKTFVRYIDDIFIIWNGDNNSLKNFKKELQSTYNLNIKWKENTQQIEFLDILIFKGKNFLNGKGLDYKTHQKSMNLYLYTPFTSNHPSHMFSGIIIGEIKRYIRTNSDVENFIEIVNQFITRLKSRGYPPSFIAYHIKEKFGTSIRTAYNNYWSNLNTTDNNLTQNTSRKVLFISTYHNKISMDIANEIAKELPKTSIDFLKAYRLNPNVKDFLVFAKE